jgi:uncharacterized protein YndB with AHSA1/START domain
MHRSSTQQTFIDAPVEQVWELVGDPNQHAGWWPDVIEAECADIREGCRYRGVVKGVFRTEERELLIENLEACREVSIFCEGTGVTTRFTLAEAQGGTFVEGHFAIEPNSIGATVFGALAGRRIMSSWLQASLANLKSAAERSSAPAA